MEKTLQVLGPAGRDFVVVYRGVERETYSCAPDCERRLTLGDSPVYFSDVLAQSGARNAGRKIAPPNSSRADIVSALLNAMRQRFSALPATFNNAILLSRCTVFRHRSKGTRGRCDAFRHSKPLGQAARCAPARCIGALRAPAGRRRGGRIRTRGAAVLRVVVRDHGDGAGVLRRPVAGGGRGRSGAAGDDRAGAERRLQPGRLQEKRRMHAARRRTVRLHQQAFSSTSRTTPASARPARRRRLPTASSTPRS